MQLIPCAVAQTVPRVNVPTINVPKVNAPQVKVSAAGDHQLFPSYC
jgi:hypothetical protein